MFWTSKYRSKNISLHIGYCSAIESVVWVEGVGDGRRRSIAIRNGRCSIHKHNMTNVRYNNIVTSKTEFVENPKQIFVEAFYSCIFYIKIRNFPTKNVINTEGKYCSTRMMFCFPKCYLYNILQTQYYFYFNTTSDFSAFSTESVREGRAKIYTQEPYII